MSALCERADIKTNIHSRQERKHVSLVFIGAHCDTVIKLITASANTARRELQLSAAHRFKIEAVRDLCLGSHISSSSPFIPLTRTGSTPNYCFLFLALIHERTFLFTQDAFCNLGYVSNVISKSGPFVIWTCTLISTYGLFLLPCASGCKTDIRKEIFKHSFLLTFTAEHMKVERVIPDKVR